MSVESVAQDQIRAFFERWQRLEDEKAAISTDLKELFAEMKANGFDAKVARKVFRDKLADPNDRAEFEAVYELYWSALSAPRAGRARESASVTIDFRGVPAGFDPETGEEVTASMQAGLEPSEVHTLGRAGSNPAPATNPEPQAATVAGAQTAGAHLAVDMSEAEPEAVESSASIQPETAQLIGTVANAMQTDVGRAALLSATDIMIEREEGTQDPQEPSSRDVSTGGEASPEAGSQAEASPGREQVTGALAGREGEREGEAVSADLPTIPEDFHPDVPPDQLEKRMRVALRLRPGCQRAWSCGASSPGLCFACRKAAQEQVA